MMEVGVSRNFGSVEWYPLHPGGQPGHLSM